VFAFHICFTPVYISNFILLDIAGKWTTKVGVVLTWLRRTLWSGTWHKVTFLACYRDLTMSNQIALSTDRRGLPGTSNSSAMATNTTIVSADLASVFECPVCFDYVLPPILQCQSGHLVCSNCRLKLTSCPTCSGPLGGYKFFLC
jgi:hypothetical protein